MRVYQAMEMATKTPLRVSTLCRWSPSSPPTHRTQLTPQSTRLSELSPGSAALSIVSSSPGSLFLSAHLCFVETLNSISTFVSVLSSPHLSSHGLDQHLGSLHLSGIWRKPLGDLSTAPLVNLSAHKALQTSESGSEENKGYFQPSL